MKHTPAKLGHGRAWTDHSQQPQLGMTVTAYFRGELATKFLIEWHGRVAIFHDGCSLRWNNNLGFIL